MAFQLVFLPEEFDYKSIQKIKQLPSYVFGTYNHRKVMEGGGALGTFVSTNFGFSIGITIEISC